MSVEPKPPTDPETDKAEKTNTKDQLGRWIAYAVAVTAIMYYIVRILAEAPTIPKETWLSFILCVDTVFNIGFVVWHLFRIIRKPDLMHDHTTFYLAAFIGLLFITLAVSYFTQASIVAVKPDLMPNTSVTWLFVDALINFSIGATWLFIFVRSLTYNVRVHVGLFRAIIGANREAVQLAQSFTIMLLGRTGLLSKVLEMIERLAVNQNDIGLRDDVRKLRKELDEVEPPPPPLPPRSD
jgi:hypothetical protein